MRSIRDIYKIGKGPSSSHTMGPERAAQLFKQEHPRAEGYRVVLYDSLAKTGVGHGTDRVLRQVLEPTPTEIVYSQETPADLQHPNTLDFFALEDGVETPRMRVQSVGGGDILIEGRAPEKNSDQVYPENSLAEIIRFCQWRKIRLWEYVEMTEGPEIWDFLAQVWKAMRWAIADGLHAEGVLPGGLNLERKAKRLYEQANKNQMPQVKETRIICAYAFAVSEQNADNGVIVTAPTCGSGGVVPAVMRYMQEQHGFSDEQVFHALAVGGLIGSLIKQNASVSGAECGCQAEVGSACAMASAALAELCGMNFEQIEFAAEIALEHHLGLTCDPICGLVQIPCIERNAVAAMRAMNCMNLAYFLYETQSISFDMVVKTMYQTGINIAKAFRETSEGGLARLYRRGR
ncbi:MAG: L-serine ammonia-lyase, iron-sulfur-dependent, subunit alpha [Oscillospiraceae bacterium]|nr:L-serine ammonia-lyase, iron-sulfur-dependent, subunit alpha [Oscillospiraceae bacterium]